MLAFILGFITGILVGQNQKVINVMNPIIKKLVEYVSVIYEKVKPQKKE